MPCALSQRALVPGGISPSVKILRASWFISLGNMPSGMTLQLREYELNASKNRFVPFHPFWSFQPNAT
jgi:hypothetical protein